MKEKLHIVSEHITNKNNKKFSTDNLVKPNEDYFIDDNINKIYIVLDGISRYIEDYKLNLHLVSDLSKLFGNNIYDYLLKHKSIITDVETAKDVLMKAFDYANSCVSVYIDNNYNLKGEIPGCVGVVSLIVNDYIYSISFGDSMGIIFRDTSKIIFAPNQTEYVFNYLKYEKDRNKLINDFINNNISPYGYAVANGEEEASKLVNFNYIKLEESDVIYLTTDGASDLIQFYKNEFINRLTLHELITESNNQDLLLNKSYFDDKTIIRIKI